MTSRILNVDDDEAGRYVSTRHLTHAGFEVMEASRGQEAIEMAKTFRPDLILLDVNLPDLSGFDVCATLRADPEFANLPVLMMSASSISGSDRVRGLTGGADAYLAEPVDASELLAVVNALLRMRRAEDDVIELNRALKAKVQELETTIETLPIGLAVARHADGLQMSANAAMAAMIGASADGGLSLDLTEQAPYVIRTDGRAVDGEALPLQRAARGETVRDQEHEIVRPDGSAIVVYAYASPLYDADGKLSGSVGAFMDVTDRKAADTRHRLLADMTELLGGALDIEKTLQGTAQIAARHLADWCVLDTLRDDGELHRVAVIHRDPALQGMADRIRDDYGPERGRSVALYRTLNEGKPLWGPELPPEVQASMDADPMFRDLIEALGMESYIAVPLVARGRSLGVMTLIRGPGKRYEETDLQVALELASRAALALDNALLFRAAEEANRAKDAFFAMVSHELRTPLTSMMGWATLLTEHEVDAETRQTGLGEIHRSVKSQARLIDDLLDTARVAAGKISLEMRKVTLDSILDEAIALVQQTLTEKHIAITTTHDAMAVVSGDRQRLVQVASNLLTNAAKFTPREGHIDARVWVDQQAGSAFLSVRDDGQGISPAFLPHIFDRFSQQQDASRIGLGLGLSIVKSFVELHGGEVTVASEGNGRGSEFVVRLPLLNRTSKAV